MCPLQFDLQQAHIYCDPELVLEEGCCEILPGGVSSWLLARAVLERGQPAQGWQRSEDAFASVLTLAFPPTLNSVPQRPPRPAETPRVMSSLRSILRQRARSTPAASAWRNLRTVRWVSREGTRETVPPPVWLRPATMLSWPCVWAGGEP